MIGNSLYPLSSRPRRSSRASTLKSSRPNPRLIATSHKLAALKRSSLSGLSIKVLACFESRWGSPAAQRRRCVSSRSFMRRRRRFARSPPCLFGRTELQGIVAAGCAIPWELLLTLLFLFFRLRLVRALLQAFELLHFMLRLCRL